jgi:hypothetical protein
MAKMYVKVGKSRYVGTNIPIYRLNISKSTELNVNKCVQRQVQYGKFANIAFSRHIKFTNFANYSSTEKYAKVRFIQIIA